MTAGDSPAGFVVERVGPGRYRITEPIPVDGIAAAEQEQLRAAGAFAE